jgi:hypothetical protein
MQVFNWQKGFRSVGVLVWLLPNIVFGQSYPLGLNPPKMKWKAIETDRVEVIYPAALEDQGQYVTNLIHLLWDSSYYSLGPKQDKVSIILQNQNTTSNGFVTVSPFRSEFYLTPPQYNFLGNVDWLTGLAIHEYRHVEQFVNAKKSITRIGSFLFGQNGWGATAGLALPRWFFEGDAVFYETALSEGGRGRMANFENQYKAMLLSGKKIPKYELASATSLKRYIPNHYNLGYHMVTGMRRDFGDSTVQKVVDRAVSYQSLIFPFSLGLKKLTGFRTPKYYKKLTTELQSDWHKEDSLENYDSGTPLLADKNRTFTNYALPVSINDSTILSLKSGFKDIQQIVSINLNTGKEQKIVETGFIPRLNATLSSNGKFVIWSQTTFHPRWELLDYAEIWGYDLVNEQLIRLTEKTRYFTPAIDRSGARIAAIYTSRAQEEHLVVINASTKKESFRYTFARGERAAFPVWRGENKIVFILQTSNANALASVDIETGEMQRLTPSWKGVLGYPQVVENQIYFNANFSGTDNIYRWDVGSQKLEMISRSRFGVVQPLFTGKNLYGSDYSNDGYEIKRFETVSEQVNVEEIVNKADFFQPVVKATPSLQTGNKVFDSKPLNQTKGLLNVHSWTPFFLPPNVDITLESDNLLSTFSADVNYSYNTNEQTSSYGVGAKYGRFFPVFEFAASKGNRSRYTPVIYESEDQLLLQTRTQQWSEEDVNIGVTIPFNTTWNNYLSSIQVSQYIHRKTIVYEVTETQNPIGTDESFSSYSLDLSAYFLRRRALQHLNSRLGLSSTISYRTTLGTTSNESNYLHTVNRLFLPGFSKNHSFNISHSFQSENFLATYKFRDNLFYTRGYNPVPHDRFTNFTFNYELPLLYPDIAVGPFLFIKRINGHIFYDLGRATILRHRLSDVASDGEVSLDLGNSFLNAATNTLDSFGMELTVDFRFLRVLDINSGIRISRPLNNQFAAADFVYEFLLFSIGY